MHPSSKSDVIANREVGRHHLGDPTAPPVAVFLEQSNVMSLLDVFSQSDCKPAVADGTASRPLQIDASSDQDGLGGPSNATSLGMPKKNGAEKHFLPPAARKAIQE
jgi:hypothetical protein